MVYENKLGKYRHYKGGEYEVLGIAVQSETLEEMVMCKNLAEFEPKIPTVEPMVKSLLRLVEIIKEEELVLI